jgi:hypothetical protein
MTSAAPGTLRHDPTNPDRVHGGERRTSYTLSAARTERVALGMVR